MEFEQRLREAVAEQEPGDGFTARVMAAVDSSTVVDIRSRQRSRIIVLGVVLCVCAAAAMLVAQLTPRDSAPRVEVAQEEVAARPALSSEGAADAPLPTDIESHSTEFSPTDVPVGEVPRAEEPQQGPVAVPQMDRSGRITLLVMPVVDRSGAPGAKDAAEAFRGQLVRDLRGMNDLVVLDSIVESATGAEVDFRLTVSSLAWRRPTRGSVDIVSSTGGTSSSRAPYLSESDPAPMPGLGTEQWPVEAKIEEATSASSTGNARYLTVMQFSNANGIRQDNAFSVSGPLLGVVADVLALGGNCTACTLADVMRQKSAPVASTPRRALPSASSTIALRPGEVRRPLPEGMRIYRELTGLANSVEREASKSDAAGDISSQAVLHRFNLGEEELAKLDKYLSFAMRSDRDNQARLVSEICSRKAGFQTLDEFGLALNEFNRKAEIHQENLGLEAAAELGAELFSKVSQPDRGQRTREQTDVDFPSLFRARNRDLQTEIARFCSQAR